MLCEEKLEVFENGFEDGKFNLRVEFYGRDARKVLLAMIRELYLPDYGPEYVYPFECAKEFWGIPLEPGDITEDEFKPSPVKFITQSIADRLEKALNDIGAPVEVKLDEAEVHRLKTGLLALGKNFVLDESRKVLFVFNKPPARGLILKYLGMLDED
ncbi:PH1570 family protein [Thermococcus zilligii]|uniref:PH1570 family protein n=1 Tax=Thermococcus zilligii TaxID=54076 RepID=UPI00029B1854|nr:PH1570 family protein [Thermococcus zilligii]